MSLNCSLPIALPPSLLPSPIIGSQSHFAVTGSALFPLPLPRLSGLRLPPPPYSLASFVVSLVPSRCWGGREIFKFITTPAAFSRSLLRLFGHIFPRTRILGKLAGGALARHVCHLNAFLPPLRRPSSADCGVSPFAAAVQHTQKSGSAVGGICK